MSKKIHNDWRLPTIQELLTLICFDKAELASRLEDTKKSSYWSVTENARHPGYAWVVNFSYGYTNYHYKLTTSYVHCVRTSKSGKLHWSKSSEKQMAFKEALEYAKDLKTKTYYKGK